MTIHWLGLADKLGSVTTLHSYVSRTGNSIQWVTSIQELRERLDNSPASVVFVMPGMAYNLYEISLELSVRYPLSSFVLAAAEDEFDLKRSMRSGAVDAVKLPADESEVIQAAREAEQSVTFKVACSESSLQNDKQRDGRVLTICGTKGGVGKTTLTVNMAVAFSKMGLKVAVLDLDLQFGDVAIMFDIQPKKTIYEWIKEEYENSAGNLEKYLMNHNSGTALLPAPLRPEFAEVVTGEHVGIAIGELRRQYDLVLIDTPPSLVETGLVALDNSSDILLVTAADLPTLKNSKLCIETLESLGLKDRLKVLLNRDTKIEGISFDSVQNVLDHAIYCRIPSDGKIVVSSVNKGVPFVLSAPRTAVSRSVFDLAAKLIAEQAVELSRTQKSFLQKLFSR